MNNKIVFTVILLTCVALMFIWFIPIPKILRSKVNELRWKNKAIDAYSIAVRASSIWHNQTVDLVVKKNQIIESSTKCVRAPAESGDCEENNLPPYNYTKDNLFSRLEDRKPHEKLRWFEIRYDPVYKIPIVIQYNDPDYLDEEFVIEVLEFNVHSKFE